MTVAVVVELDHPEVDRHLLGLHGDRQRGAGLAVVLDQRAVVERREDVAVHRQERALEIGHHAQGSGRAERLLRLPVPVELERIRDDRALAEVDADQVAEVADAEVGLGEPGGRELAQDDLEDRPVADGEEGLRQDRRVGPEPHSEAPGEDDRSHPSAAYRYAGGVPAWQVPARRRGRPRGGHRRVADTYRSGWLSMGPRTGELEAALRRVHRRRARARRRQRHGGAAPDRLGAGLGPGDEVVVPSLTFVASVNAVAYTGATPVFADIAALERPWLSGGAVEAAITPRTKAIMAVAYGGHPGEIDGAARPGRASAACCCSRTPRTGAGVRLGGRHLGTFGPPGRSASSPTRTSRWARAAPS